MATNNFLFAQLQPYSLSGAGAAAGATSITLKTMTDIDGAALSMSGTFGAIGYGTLEPGNGTQEEQISFTGLTNNSGGTVTLSGVKTVLFTYPYTESSGLAKTHPGSATFVISNTAGFYNKQVSKDDDATITGLYTFPNGANTPVLGASYVAPTLQPQVASKGYVDAVAIAGAPDATTAVKGIVQIPTQAQVDAGTATGSTGASLSPTPALLRSKLLSDYVADTGAADAYAIAPSPAITAYAVGQIFSFKATNANTTASTLAVSGLTTKAIKKYSSVALSAGDIASGQICLVEYDGTNFQLLNPTAVNLPSITASDINKVITTTNGTSFVMGRPFDYQAFTSSGTWTKPTNTSGNEMVLIQCWGAGGGGGNLSTGGGSGGGGGAYVERIVTASVLGATETVTIGTGGAGAASPAAGSSTTFGSKVTAYGGGAGLVGAAATEKGGGGGGGVLAVGANAVNTAGAVGGGPLGGGEGLDSSFGGGGGGGNGTSIGGKSAYGGGGGGNGHSGTAGQDGGASLYGGGGGAGGGSSTNGTGGTSAFGGAGGNAGVAGSAPGGGGGGGGTGVTTGGAGARGEVRVWTFL